MSKCIIERKHQKVSIYSEMISLDIKRNPENRRTKLFLRILRKQQMLYTNQEKRVLKNVLLGILRFILFDKYCVEIDSSTIIGGGLRIPHLQGIVIAKNVVIGNDCTVFHQVTIGVNEKKSVSDAPYIGNNVYIGVGAKIIGNIKVGDNVTIGANAVVTQDIPENAIVTGFNNIKYKKDNQNADIN